MTKRRKKTPPQAAELRQTIRTLLGTYGRGGAVMAAAWLDDALELYLKRILSRDESVAKDLFGFDRPLGAFGTRIKLAYLLGLISREIREDLDAIRLIRNDLAHVRQSIGLNEDPDLRRRCAQLHTYQVFAANVVKPPRTARQQLIISAYLLAEAFLALADDAQPFPDQPDAVLLYVRRLTKKAGLRQSLSLYTSAEFARGGGA